LGHYNSVLPFHPKFVFRCQGIVAGIGRLLTYRMQTRARLASRSLSRPLPLRLLILLLILLATGSISVGCLRIEVERANQLTVAERDARLRQIAADYARDNDLARAQAALDELGLANPAQLLITMAEQDLDAGQPAEEIAALARLAEALGTRSPRLSAYLTPTYTPSSMPATVPASPAYAATPTTELPVSTHTPTLAPTATATPLPLSPRVRADKTVNLRSGPGLAYPVIAQLRAGQEAEIIARNESGDWWQVAWDKPGQAWVAGMVVKVSGPIDTVPVATEIPPPPPTATPAPPKPTSPPQPAGPDFRLVSVRLWTVQENGGWFDGPSLHCGEKRELRVYVLDAAGNPLNGVTVKAVYGNQEEVVTGSKGPGMAEFVLGGGQDVYVVRDVDGRPVTSDYARGMSTDPRAIPYETLMGAGFCNSTADCDHFVSQRGCKGHYSWDVVFQRAY
jgi:hypothetical protein